MTGHSMKICLYVVMFAAGWHGVAIGEASRSVSLRREYNLVAASIDTLARLYDQDDIERLGRWRDNNGLLPPGFDMVLLFWADDEAEVFVNGFKVGQTRLTPTLIEIPEIYLREQNRLEAYCWDTDQVESGFMAGLYLRDQAGGLRRVIATGDGTWQAGQQPAETIYYSHAQPDIPGARVIWAEQLFGAVELTVDFGARSFDRALTRPEQAAPGRVDSRSMEMHDLVSKLVALEERRLELAQLLDDLHTAPELKSGYRGHADSQMALTLGRVAPLIDRESVNGVESLRSWVDRLPEKQKQIVIRRGRELKGRSAATSIVMRMATSTGSEDRRREYSPPRERGGLLADTGSGSAQAGRVTPVRGARFSWGLFAATMLMAAYVGMGGRRWLQLYAAKEWMP